MTDQEKSNLLDIIINCESEHIINNMIKVLRKTKIKNKKALLKILNIMSLSNKDFNTDIIYLSTKNQKLLNNKNFIDYIKIINDCDNYIDSQNLYRLAVEYNMTDYSSFDTLINTLKKTDSLNIRSNIIDTTIIIMNYNKNIAKNNKVPDQDLSEIIKILANSKDEQESKEYKEKICDIKILNNSQRLEIIKNNFNKKYNEFIHRLIWDSNILDGFEINDIRNFEEQLNNPVFRTEVVQKLGDMIYQKLFNSENVAQ